MKKILLLLSIGLMSCIESVSSENGKLKEVSCDEKKEVTQEGALAKQALGLPVLAEVDELMIDVTYRDFSPHHPDFETFETHNPNTTCNRRNGSTSVSSAIDVTTGMVENKLKGLQEFV
jgi:hypothetical protein